MKTTETTINFSTINKLAIPAIFAGIVEPLLSMTDAAIIGHIPKNATAALAAVGLAGSFISALVWGLSASSVAISSLVGQYLGKNKLLQLKPLVTQVFYGHIIFGLLLITLGYTFATTIFDLYKAKDLVHHYAVVYFEIRVFGVLFTLLTLFMFGVFRGLQNTVTAMYISWSGFIINVVLSLIFVYLLDYGIAGAAYASLIAQVTMFALALYFLLKNTVFDLKYKKENHTEMPYFLKLFFNFIARTFFINLVLFLANRQATSYGKNYIAAQTIAINIWLFSSFFIDGYANAGNALSGKLLGEQSHKKLWTLSLKVTKYSVFAAVFLMAIYSIFYKQIVATFIDKTAVQTVFLQFFWLVILMQPINAIAFALDGVFKGLGKAVLLRNLLFGATFFGFIPTLFIADYYGLKMYSIWLAFAVWMLARAGVLFFYMKGVYKVEREKFIK